MGWGGHVLKHYGRSIVIGVIVLALSACDQPPPASSAPSLKSVKVLAVAPAGEAGARSFSGVLAPAETTRLAFSISGRLVDVPLREGESFAAGAVVARLDDLDISREITSARARLSAARSRLAEADNNYARQKTLADRGLVARATLDQIVRERDTASADLKVAQTELQIAQDRLIKTRLVAARAGVVTRLVAKQYEEVAAGAAVYEVGSGENLEAEVLVPEQIVTLLKLGAPVNVRVPGLGDATVAATIAEIGAGADSGNAFRVKARLAATPPAARSGMTAVLALDLGAEAQPSFDIPTSALAFENILTAPGVGAEARVYVLDEQVQRVDKRTVRIAGLHGSRVLVDDGLRPGDLVVVAGVAFLDDGMPARRWSPPE